MERTVPDIDYLFQPLENVTKEDFIPALCGHEVTDAERQILALPYRYGGMGILNPAQSAQFEYATSKEMNSELSGST